MDFLEPSADVIVTAREHGGIPLKINRPGVAGAVLQTLLSFTDSFIQSLHYAYLGDIQQSRALPGKASL